MNAHQEADVAELRSQIEKLSTASRDADEKQRKLEQADQAKKDRGDLLTRLGERGMAATPARVAVNHLLAENLVRRAGDGELVFVKRGSNGRELCEVDLDEGLRDFLRTPDGEIFREAQREKRSEQRAKSPDKPDTAKARAARALTAFRRGA